ncbi:non-homologous end-joining DNA ligase [Pseudonocardia xishanensis]|uniref:non-homologous end-joining DNA ligase n=1 Tax=Pseudonocardia xishanensis TaxID=630995 RepID=UPI0031E67716
MPRSDESLRPMLATAGVPPVGPGWAVEFKWDGVRALVVVRGGAVRLVSRNGNDVTGGYPELVAALPTDRDLVLDGEIVALDAAGRPDFGLLQHRMHVRSPGAALLAEVPVELYLFDVLEIEGEDLTGLPYDTRRARLAELGVEAWRRVSAPQAFTDITPAQGLDVARAHRLEGIVAKRRTARYEPGRRSGAWVKTALFHPQEVVLGGWTAGRGNRGSTLGALLMGAYDEHGRLRYLGNVGSGFSEATLRRLLDRLRPLARPDSPFDDEVPRELRRGVTWVEPEVVGEVEYRTLTHDRRLRHTVWRGLRPDRDPGEIVLADVVEAARAPDPELVRYLREIAPHLLPYVDGHPLVAPTGPVAVGSEAALVGLAETGVVELRFAPSRPGEHPRWVVVELEAGAAGLLRTALDHLGVVGMPVVTGHGLQVHVPVGEGTTAAEAGRWAERLCAAVGSMAPGARPMAATAALVPFSPTRDGAVAVPVTWAELEAPELPRWTLDTAPVRVAEAGDPLRPLLGLDQRLPPL